MKFAIIRCLRFWVRLKKWTLTGRGTLGGFRWKPTRPKPCRLEIQGETPCTKTYWRIGEEEGHPLAHPTKRG